MADNLHIGDIISVNVDSRLNGQQLLLTTNWMIDDIVASDPVPYFTGMADFATALDVPGALFAQLAGVYSNEVLQIRAYLQRIAPTRNVRVEVTPTLTEGQIDSPSLPSNVAVVITCRTDDAGRNQISNKHIGGVPNSFVADSFVNPSIGLPAYNELKTALVTGLSFETTLNTIHVSPVILRKSNVLLSPIITNGIVQRTSRVERRRTVGLGS